MSAPHNDVPTVSRDISELSEIVTTRLCHDLAGLISAFNNGAEILGDKPDESMYASSVELLKMSAEDASSRLRVFRKLYGVDKSDSVNFYETSELLKEYLRGFTVVAQPDSDLLANLPAYAEKVALAYALIIHKAFPRKAEVTFSCEDGAFTMRASGKYFMLDEEERNTLTRLNSREDAAPLTYKNLAAHTILSICAQQGANASADIESNALRLTIADL